MGRIPKVEWQTVGHEFPRQVLSRQLARASTAHAYVFFGPEGVGKRTLALELALKLGAEKQDILEFDFNSANTEELRGFLSKLSLRPSRGAHQVAILDSVELMHAASSNTLLKTLEEPTLATTIILISTKRNLPATILSRAQVLGFGSLSLSELELIAGRLGLDCTGDMAHLANGRAGELVTLARDAHKLEDRMQWQKDWRDFAAGNLSARLAAVQKLAALEAIELERRLCFWMAQEMAAVGTAKLLVRLSVLMETLRRLSANGNKKMVLEYLCLNLG